METISNGTLLSRYDRNPKPKSTKPAKLMAAVLGFQNGKHTCPNKITKEKKK